MQKGLIAGCALGVAMGWAPSALGATAGAKPLSAAQVSHLRTIGDGVLGSNCPSVDVCAFFDLKITTANGIPSAALFVQSYDQATDTFLSVFCEGPEYAQSPNVIAVDKDGRATVFLTLDPLAPNCNGNFASPVTVNLSAQPTGAYHELTDGTTRVDAQGGLSLTSSFRREYWDAIINGTVGAVSGPFAGTTELARTREKNKAK